MAEFFKLSGSGNDFLALAETAEPPAPEAIRAWCRRGVSLGADGLFVLRRAGSGGGAGRVEMDYYNADGFPADLCLNGTRCAAQLAFHLGWAGETVTVATPAGAFAASRPDGSRITLELPPVTQAPRELELELSGATLQGWFLTVGVPHLVVPWSERLSEAPVTTLGREARWHPDLQPAGANVNFVRYPHPHRMEIRTFERGVEDETLSCGSGVLASVAVGWHLGRLQFPVKVLTAGGFELEVAADRPADPAAAPWRLTGDARLVARGELLPGGTAEPAPPAWT